MNAFWWETLKIIITDTLYNIKIGTVAIKHNHGDYHSTPLKEHNVVSAVAMLITAVLMVNNKKLAECVC